MKNRQKQMDVLVASGQRMLAKLENEKAHYRDVNATGNVIRSIVGVMREESARERMNRRPGRRRAN